MCALEEPHDHLEQGCYYEPAAPVRPDGDDENGNNPALLNNDDDGNVGWEEKTELKLFFGDLESCFSGAEWKYVLLAGVALGRSMCLLVSDCRRLPVQVHPPGEQNLPTIELPGRTQHTTTRTFSERGSFFHALESEGVVHQSPRRGSALPTHRCRVHASPRWSPAGGGGQTPR